MTTIEIEVTAERKGSEVKPFHQLHQGFPAGKMIDVSTEDNLVMLPKIV